MSFYSVLQPWKKHIKETNERENMWNSINNYFKMHLHKFCSLTGDTHTFPMYRLGQTSSTGVSSSLQESKMSSSSLISTRSCGWLLPDILPGHRALLQQTPTQLLLSMSTVPSPPESAAQWETQAGGCLKAAPKLALCVQWVLSDWMWSYLMLLLHWLVCSMMPKIRGGNRQGLSLSPLRSHQQRTRGGEGWTRLNC